MILTQLLSIQSKQSEKAWFIKGSSKLCLLRWHLVMNFEKHFVTLLNLRTPTIYMCFLTPSHTRIFWLSVSSSGFLWLWTVVIFPWQKHDQISLHFFKPFLQSRTHPCHSPPSCLSSSPPSSSLLLSLNSGHEKSIGESTLPPFINKVKSQKSKSLSFTDYTDKKQMSHNQSYNMFTIHGTVRKN